MDEQGVRLNKRIADAGRCSRRAADELIRAGRVAVDGRAARLGETVLESAAVTVDGEPLGGKRRRTYIALHKPEGVVCTTDPREPDNVADFVGHEKRLFPVGRLDKDSSGLLILTDDGDIVNGILRPEYGHEREYLVRVNRDVTEEFLEKLRSGVSVLGRTTLPCEASPAGAREFRLTLTQGLNRQIRRMCESCGYRVVALRRDRIMNVRLGRLKPGHWRNLTDAEVAGLTNNE